MQALLISLATAVTLAIGGAFAAPLVIDWNTWRSSFESALGRTLGLPVVIRGPIEATILPAPRVVLRDVSLGDVVSTGALVDEMRAELSLGALLRGELSATGVTLKHPQVRLLIDSAGHLALPVGTRRPSDMAIARFTMENGSLDLLDRGADRTVRLEGVDLTGEVRSLAGPFRLEGEVTAPGGRYGVRAQLGEIGADGAGKLRLAVDGRTTPIALDLDGSFAMAGGRPRYDGRLAARRKAGEGLDGWHAAATVRADPEAVAADTLEIAIGDETGPAQFQGTARLGLGRGISLQAELSARTLDLDTLHAAREAAVRHQPAGKTSPAPPPAVPPRADGPMALATGALGLVARLPAVNATSRVKLSVERLFLGGAPLQQAEAILAGEADGWRIEKAAARLPGGAEASLSGRATGGGDTLGFAGEVALAVQDPAGFLRWAAPDAAQDYLDAVAGPARIASRVSLAPPRLVLEGLNASFGAARLDGAVSAALDPARGPRLDMKLNMEGFALEPLLDAARRAAESVGGGADAHLALTGKALTVSGLHIGSLAVDAAATGGNWRVSRLAMDDLEGLAVEGGGRLENVSTVPRGTFQLALTGADPKGLVPLARQVAGEGAAAAVARLLPLASPVRLTSNVEWGEAGGRNIVTEGSLGAISGRLTLARTNAGVPLSIALSATARDGPAALAALGLSGLAPRLGPAEVSLAIDPLTPGEASVKGRLALADSTIGGEGTARLAQDGAVMPRLALRLDSPDLGRLMPRLGRVAEGAALPAALTFSLTRSGALWRLEDLSGSFARLPARGTLGFEPGAVPRIEGRLGFDDLALADVLGLITVRVPRAATNPPGPWSYLRFLPPAGEPVALDLELTADRLAVVGPYVLGDARLRLAGTGTILDVRDLTGSLGGGRAGGALRLERTDDLVKARGRLKLDSVAAAALLAPTGASAAPGGQVSLTLDLAGSGRSLRALVQDLSGGGTLSVERLVIPRAAPAALDDVLRQAGAMAEPPGERIATRLFDDALAKGPLALPAAEGTLTVAEGAVRLSPLRAQAGDVRVGLEGRLDLFRLFLDVRLDLAGADGPGGAPGGSLFWRGALSDPERRASATALAGVLAARAVERETRRLEAERNGAAPAQVPIAAPPASVTVAPATAAPASVTPAPSRPVAPRPAAPGALQPAGPAARSTPAPTVGRDVETTTTPPASAPPTPARVETPVAPFGASSGAEDAGTGTGEDAASPPGSLSDSSTSPRPAAARPLPLPPVPRAEPAPPVRRSPPAPPASPAASQPRERPHLPQAPRPPAALELPPAETPEQTLPPTRGFGDLPRPPALVGR